MFSIVWLEERFKPPGSGGSGVLFADFDADGAPFAGDDLDPFVAGNVFFCGTTAFSR